MTDTELFLKQVREIYGEFCYTKYPLEDNFVRFYKKINEGITISFQVEFERINEPYALQIHLGDGLDYKKNTAFIKTLCGYKEVKNGKNK